MAAGGPGAEGRRPVLALGIALWCGAGDELQGWRHGGRLGGCGSDSTGPREHGAPATACRVPGGERQALRFVSEVGPAGLTIGLDAGVAERGEGLGPAEGFQRASRR